MVGMSRCSFQTAIGASSAILNAESCAGPAIIGAETRAGQAVGHGAEHERAPIGWPIGWPRGRSHSVSFFALGLCFFCAILSPFNR